MPAPDPSSMPEPRQRRSLVDEDDVRSSYFSLPMSQVDREPVAELQAGQQVGELTPRRSAYGEDRVLADCTCGGQALWRADHILSGLRRDCGDVLRHGR